MLKVFRNLVIISIILFLVGCTTQPEQTIVERPVDEPSEPPLEDITGEVVEPPVEIIPEPEEPAEPPTSEPVIPAEKGTLVWALEISSDTAKAWVSDARIFEVKGYNLGLMNFQ